jgi:hypothetical protein
MFSRSVASTILLCISLITPAWGGHTLTSQEQKILETWLARHLEFRVATDADCDCAEDIDQMRTDYGGNWPSVPTTIPTCDWRLQQ